jgi:hypothetical protein
VLQRGVSQRGRKRFDAKKSRNKKKKFDQSPVQVRSVLKGGKTGTGGGGTSSIGPTNGAGVLKKKSSFFEMLANTNSGPRSAMIKTPSMFEVLKKKSSGLFAKKHLNPTTESRDTGLHGAVEMSESKDYAHGDDGGGEDDGNAAGLHSTMAAARRQATVTTAAAGDPQAGRLDRLRPQPSALL